MKNSKYIFNECCASGRCLDSLSFEMGRRSRAERGNVSLTVRVRFRVAVFDALYVGKMDGSR